MNKKCRKCTKDKPLYQFGKNNISKDKLQYECKKCVNKSKIESDRSKYGLPIRIYSNQKINSKQRNNQMPLYSVKELREWLYSHKLYHELWSNWKCNGYIQSLTPSVDRINDYKGYSLDNIQLMTWDDNRKKGHKDRKEGRNNKSNKAVICINLITGITTKHHSISEASRKTLIDVQHISRCCNGQRKTVNKKTLTFKYDKLT